jgi:hypothetical protein
MGMVAIPVLSVVTLPKVLPPLKANFMLAAETPFPAESLAVAVSVMDCPTLTELAELLKETKAIVEVEGEPEVAWLEFWLLEVL